jgi:hypothetical protein
VVRGYRLAVFTFFAACHAGSPPRPQPAACRPPDALSERTLFQLRALATAIDSTEAASRDSLRFPSVPAAAVTLVRDEATCHQALEAFNAIQGTAQRQRQLHVYRYGTHFLAEDPELEGRGEYRAFRVFDARWRYQSTLATF